ncbi:hypothetical protein Tco_0666055 [Tanacetum coccineum]
MYKIFGAQGNASSMAATLIYYVGIEEIPNELIPESGEKLFLFRLPKLYPCYIKVMDKAGDKAACLHLWCVRFLAVRHESRSTAVHMATRKCSAKCDTPSFMLSDKIRVLSGMSLDKTPMVGEEDEEYEENDDEEMEVLDEDEDEDEEINDGNDSV